MEKKKQEHNGRIVVNKTKDKKTGKAGHSLVYTELPGKGLRTIMNRNEGISVIRDADKDAAQKEESGKRTRAIRLTPETW